MNESHSERGVEHERAVTVADHGAHDHGGHDHSTHDHGGHEHAGHEHAAHDHSAHDPAQFRRKFWLSLALTVPTLVFSTGLQSILGLGGPRFPGSQYIPAVFGVAIFFYGGLVFLRGAVSELRARQPGMMTLISLAIVVALGYSLAVTLGLKGMDFWWELATLITIMLLGHWIEMSAVMGARDALGELAKLLPDEAELVHGDHVMTVAVASLVLGDTVLVRPGGAIPVDGEVIEGESDVDEALLTGESAAVGKAVGSAVIAGSTNGAGALTIRVGAVGGQTAIAGIMRLVDEAQRSKSGAQVLADRAAGLLFYVAVGAAIITLAAWLLLKPGDPGFVLERVVSVLVIACPHALGLAIPLVSQISTSLGAKQGILVKNKLALEAARRVDVVLFDKTGTLTTGMPSVTAVVSADGGRGAATGVDRANEVLALAASVEAKSEHPLASAIVAEARTRGLKVVRAAKFGSLAGRGATATVAGRELTVASQRLLTERAITLPAELVHATREHSASGATIVYLLATATAIAKASASAKASATAKAKAKAEPKAEVLGLIALTDTVRPEAPEAVSMLIARGIRVAMLTGDSHAVAASVAATLGITEVFAEVLPSQKADVVHKLQSAGDRVAMVGDGVNDAPALALADVGIAIGAGTDVAIESAGIVLASSDPRGVAKLFTLSRATWRKELQNLFWATGYNAVGIPLAAGVAAGVGFVMPPAVAAIFMSVSTIIVAANAQLLRLLKLR
jgi:Cu2+-exporting ATPase